MHAEVENRRLKLKNWLDAVNGRWIDESRVEEMEEFERELFKPMLIAYQTGKGNHLVPVLIPEVENRRLKLKNWLDAVNGRWIDESRVEEMEQFERELFKPMLIAYQTGKGNHLVPVLIPRDCVSGLNTLTDPHVRTEVGILEGNPYEFPNTSILSFTY